MYMYKCIYMSICMCVYTYIYICIYIINYVYVYMHVYTHLSTHIYIYIHICRMCQAAAANSRPMRRTPLSGCQPTVADSFLFRLSWKAIGLLWATFYQERSTLGHSGLLFLRHLAFQAHFKFACRIRSDPAKGRFSLVEAGLK